jgi:hypothetical protein
MQNKTKKRKVERVYNQQGLDQQGETTDLEPVYERTDEKIEVDLGETVRIRPHDLENLMHSYHEFLALWDK